MLHLIRKKATPQQIAEMLQDQIMFIKVVVDIRRGILAGGGRLHIDAEQILLADGSQQQDIWGASWTPDLQAIDFESMINIRPRQNNHAMLITDAVICERITAVVQNLLGEV